jgi:hypothetical protein
MNHYVTLSLTNRKSSVHLQALYSPRTALRTFTPRRDQLVIWGQYVTLSTLLCLQFVGYYIVYSRFSLCPLRSTVELYVNILSEFMQFFSALLSKCYGRRACFFPDHSKSSYDSTLYERHMKIRTDQHGLRSEGTNDNTYSWQSVVKSVTN